jgi:hypothetical protein
MDPDVALQMFREHMANAEYAAEHGHSEQLADQLALAAYGAASLFDWLGSGGYPPRAWAAAARSRG